MDEGTPGTEGYLTVTVVAGGRRADLAVAHHVAVGELLPQVADLLDAKHVPSVLTRATGDPLEGALGLREQGVHDGAVLVLAPIEYGRPPTLHDDPAEAMAEAVSAWVRPRPPGFARSACLGAAVTSFGVLLPALLLDPRAPTVSAVSGGLAMLLPVAAAAMARARRPSEAVGLGWAAAAMGAVAGLCLVPEAQPPMTMVVGGATGGAASSGLALALSPGARVAQLPPVMALAAVGLTAAVVLHSGVAPGVAFAGLLVLTVSASLAVAELGVAAGRRPSSRGTRSVRRGSERHEPTPREHAERAHQLVVAQWTTTGMLVVTLAPVVARQGPWGAGLAAACCSVPLLRSRRHRSGREAAAAVAAGAGGVLTGAMATLVTFPGSRPWMAGAATAFSAGALLAGIGAPWRSPWSTRVADLLEVLLIASLLPLLILSAGLLDAVAALRW